jgi:hypothetical protein
VALKFGSYAICAIESCQGRNAAALRWFPEINIDNITKILGMNITFVTSAKTDEEGYALLREFGLPFKNAKKD